MKTVAAVQTETGGPLRLEELEQIILMSGTPISIVTDLKQALVAQPTTSAAPGTADFNSQYSIAVSLRDKAISAWTTLSILNLYG